MTTAEKLARMGIQIQNGEEMSAVDKLARLGIVADGATKEQQSLAEAAARTQAPYKTNYLTQVAGWTLPVREEPGLETGRATVQAAPAAEPLVGTPEWVEWNRQREQEQLETQQLLTGGQTREKAALDKAKEADWVNQYSEIYASLPQEMKDAFEEYARLEGTTGGKSREEMWVQDEDAVRQAQLGAQLRAQTEAQGVNWQEMERYVKMHTGQKQAAEEAAAAAAYAQENAAGATAGSVGTALTAPLQAADLIGQRISRAITGSDAPLNTYSDMQRVGRTGEVLRGTVAGNIEAEHGKAAAFLYNVGMSGADSLASIGAGALAPLVLASNAGASTARQAMDEGASSDQAMQLGFAAAVAEGVFEKISLGNLKSFKEVSVKTLKDASMNLLKTMGVNASEEMATEVANILADGLIRMDESALSREGQAAYDEAIAAGASQEEAEKARRKAMGEAAIKQVGLAGLSGALMGFGFGVGGNAVAYGANKLTAPKTGAETAAAEGGELAAQKEKAPPAAEEAGEAQKEEPLVGTPEWMEQQKAQAAEAQTAQPELPGMVMSPDGTQMRFEAPAEQAAQPLVGTPEWVKKTIDEADRESYSEGNPTQGGMTDGREENEDEGRGAPGVLQIDLGHDAGPGLHTGGTDANDAGEVRRARQETDDQFARRNWAEGKRVINTRGDYVSYKPAKKAELSEEYLYAVELLEANKHVVTLADGIIEKHIRGGPTFTEGSAITREGRGITFNVKAEIDPIEAAWHEMQHADYNKKKPEAVEYHDTVQRNIDHESDIYAELAVAIDEMQGFSRSGRTGKELEAAIDKEIPSYLIGFVKAGKDLKHFDIFYDADEVFRAMDAYAATIVVPARKVEAAQPEDDSWVETYRTEEEFDPEDGREAVSERTRTEVKDLGARYGRKVRFENLPTGENGYYDNATGEIVISSRLRPGQAAMTVMKHELTHSTEGGEAYAQLRQHIQAGGKAVNRWLAKVSRRARQQFESVEAYAEWLRAEYARRGVELDGEGAMQEAVANFVQDELFASEAAIKELAEGNRSLAKRILDFIREAIGRVTGSEKAELQKLERLYQKALRETEGESGSGDRQHMFAGVSAETRDNGALAEAAAAENSGKDPEETRKETGWFRGADDRWRFEIDDSGAKWNSRGDLGARRKNEGYDRYRSLTEKQEQAMLFGGELLSDAESAEWKALNREWGTAEQRGNRVGDYLEHKALYEAYPQLREMELEILTPGEMPKGVLGYYSHKDRKVVLRRGAAEEMKSSLLHELQHAVQHIEGFANGSSIEYWEQTLEEGGYPMTKGLRDARRALAKWRAGKSMETLQKLDDLAGRYAAADVDELDKVDKEIADSGLEDEFWELDDLKFDLALQLGAAQEMDNPTDLYYNTAGEIEARDTQARARLTAADRKQKKPNTGNNDTVFSGKTERQHSIDLIAEMNEGIAAEQKRKAEKVAETMDYGNPRAMKRRAGEESYAQLSRRNRQLEEQVKALKEEFRLTQGHRMDAKYIHALAGKLLHDKASGYDRSRFETELTELFEGIANDKEMSWEAAMAQAAGLMRRVLESSSRAEPSLREQDSRYEELYKALGGTIALRPEEYRAVTAAFGKPAGGRILGLKVKQGDSTDRSLDDRNHNELSRSWPEFFGPELTDAEAVFEAMAEARRVVNEKQYVNDYAQEMESAAAEAAQELFEAYMRAPEKHTFADTQAKRLEQVKAAYSERLLRQREQNRESWEKREARLKGQMERTKAQAAKQVEKAREETAQAKRREKLAVDTQYKKELRRSIEKSRSWFTQVVTRPSNEKKVPRDLMQAAAKVAELVNLMDVDEQLSDTQTQKKLAETLAKIRQVQKSQDYAISSQWAESGVVAMIEELQEELIDAGEYKPLAKMERYQLEAVDKILKAIKHNMTEANKLIDMETRASVQEFAEEATQEVRMSRGVKEGKGSHARQVKADWQMMVMSPRTFFNSISGWKHGKVDQLRQELNRGQKQMFRLQKEAAAYFEEVTGRENQKKMDAFSGRKAEMVDIGFKDAATGEKVPVSHAQLCSIWMHLQNEQNVNHMMHGGLAVPDPELYAAGRTTEAFAKSKRVLLGDPELAMELRGRIEKAMDDYDRAWVKKARPFFDEWCRRRINETSLKLVGFSKAGIENYFPINSDKNFADRDFSTIIMNGSIEGMGMLKERVAKAANPIMLEDINKVISRQSENVSLYAGLAIPVRNFNRVWNASSAGWEDSLHNAVAHKWGSQAVKYVDDLMGDLNKSPARRKDKNPLSSLLGQVRRNYAQAVLTLNPNSAVSQVSGYPAAASVLGWKAINKGWGDFVSMTLPGGKKRLLEQVQDEMAEHSPLGWVRQKGATQELYDMQANPTWVTRLANKWEPTSKLISWLDRMDENTVAGIWQAAKYAAEETGLKRGSKEFWEKTTDLFERAVEETQPNYTAMQQAAIARSPNEINSFATMFKSPTLANANVLMDAIGEFKEAMRTGGPAKQKKAREQLGRAAGAQIVQALLWATISVAAKGIFFAKWDDDRDETGTVTALQTMGNILYNATGSLVDAASPVGGEMIFDAVASAITGKKYWGGIDNQALDLVGDIITDLNSLIDEGASPKEIGNAVVDLCTAFGVPAIEARNWVKGAMAVADDIKNREFAQGSYETTATNVAAAAGKAMKGKRNYDMTNAQRVVDRWYRDWQAKNPEGETEAAQSSLKSALRKAHREEYLAADEETRQKMAEILTGLTLEGENIIDQEYLDKWVFDAADETARPELEGKVSDSLLEQGAYDKLTEAQQAKAEGYAADYAGYLANIRTGRKDWTEGAKWQQELWKRAGKDEDKAAQLLGEAALVKAIFAGITGEGSKERKIQALEALGYSRRQAEELYEMYG